jgi:two-component sensor histidine kinase
VANFVESVDGRIRLMATTHELASSGRWHGISLTELVRGELAPYATHNNTEICGPEVILKAEAGQAMAMVVHELATNAAKHGALSTKKGRVSIRWDRPLDGASTPSGARMPGDRRPPVGSPDKSSFGMSKFVTLSPTSWAAGLTLRSPRKESGAEWNSPLTGLATIASLVQSRARMHHREGEA